MIKLTQEQSKFVEDNHGLIYSFIHKYKLDIDEWYDLCAIGLIKAVQAYDSEKGSFSTLAYKCMFNEMTKELVYKTRHYPETLSIDLEYHSDKGDPFTLLDVYDNHDTKIEDIVLDNVYLNELKIFFYDNLRTDKQKKVIELLFDGKDKDCALKEAGLTSEAFSQAIDKIYKKYVRRFGSENTKNSKRKQKILNQSQIKYNASETLVIKKDSTLKTMNAKKRKSKPFSKGFNVGDKIRPLNYIYSYTIKARDDRYIICTRKTKSSSNTDYFIIDLKEKVYGQDNMIFAPCYDTEEDCQQRLKELQNNQMAVSKKYGTKLNFEVA